METNTNLTLISELKAGDIRCKIQNKDKDGNESYITIFNIQGEKRARVMKDLEEILTEDDLPIKEVFNLFYTRIIIEFTDLVVDENDISFLLDSSTLTGKMLVQELNDMIYEIQYDIAMEQLATIRNMSLQMITEAGLKDMQYAEERLKKSTEKRDNHRKRNEQSRRAIQYQAHMKKNKK